MYFYEGKEHSSSLLPISTTYCKKQVIFFFSCISPWTVMICCVYHVALIVLQWILFGLEENVIFMAQQGLSKRIWITGNRENMISYWHNIVSKSWFSFWVVPQTTLYSTTYLEIRHFYSSFRIEDCSPGGYYSLGRWHWKENFFKDCFKIQEQFAAGYKAFQGIFTSSFRHFYGPAQQSANLTFCTSIFANTYW